MKLIIKKYSKKIILLLHAVTLCSSLGLYSCTKEDKLPTEQIENLGGYRAKGDPIIDEWIKNNLTRPFNVRVKYEYDPFEVDYTKNTAPAELGYVIPVMQMVQQSMIAPYLHVSDSAFVKQIIPKLWVLVGSGQYNDDGTVVLGQAEGANKITIMDMNKYARNADFVGQTTYTIHHETAHILHQTKLYSPLFKYINPGLYTVTWFNVKDADALYNGFVRNYAMSNPDDDFVETIAFLLTKGQAEYDKLIANASEIGASRFKLKEQYVVEYFKDKWKIDFRELQKLVLQGNKDYIDGK